MPPDIDTSTEFSVAIIPDTQFYCENNNGIFEQMCQWVADNQGTYNIQTVLHEGDVVQNPGTTAEWDIAEDAMGRIDALDIPNLISYGNHDADDLRNPVELRDSFPASRYDNVASANSTVVDYGMYNGNPENVYFRQELLGEDYLFIATELTPRDEILTWIDSVLESHSDAIGIMTTHAYLFHDGTWHDSGDPYHPSGWSISDYNDGENMWHNLVRDQSNLHYITGGHMIDGPYVARRFDETDPGANAHQTFMNYQDISNGGDGWLRLLIVDTETQDARVRTYSPYLDSWSSDSGENFNINLVKTMEDQFSDTGTYRTQKLSGDGGLIDLSSGTDWSDFQESITNAEIADGSIKLQTSSSLTVPDSSDLHAHYDATELSGLSDGDTVSTWADQSGNAYDLAATNSPVYKPDVLNGNAIVRYGGSGDYHQVNFSAISQPTTIYVVVDANAFDARSVVESADGTDRQILRSTDSTDGWAFWAGDSFQVSGDTSTPVILGGVFNSTDSILRVNGAETAANPGTNGLAGLTLGAQYDGSQNYLDGDIAEVLVYPQDKSGIVTDIEQYLSDKWGISLA